MEDRKEYSIIGKVEIGTDEYRDLIEDRVKMEKEKDRYMRESWKKDDTIKNLENDIKSLESELEKLKSLISANPTILDDKGISVVLSMLGEK